MNAVSAAKGLCMTTVCTFIYLRLTFGGSSSPSEWRIIMEILTDLANDIMNSPNWFYIKTYAREPDPSQLPPPLLNPLVKPKTVHILFTFTILFTALSIT